MNEADLAMTEAAMSAGNANARFAQDDGLFVVFHLHPELNETKSAEEGRPIYEEQEYITIIIPGDKDNIVDRKVMQQDRERFPRQYMAFKAKEDQPQVGTPLEEWSGVSRSQIEELKFFNVTTVEALAAIPDSQSQKFMGINALKQKALAYIEDTSLAAPFEQLQQENQVLKDEIAVMKDQLAQLTKDDDGKVQKRK